MPELSGAMGNDLEKVTVTKYPLLQDLMDSLKAYGAVKTLMSGSGPTVFGMFSSAEKAEEAASLMKQIYDEIKIETAHTVREGY